MFRKKTTPTTIESLIGASMRLEGNVTFQGGLRIDGHVRGDVTTNCEEQGLLVIGEHARVEGDIVACHLIVNGHIAGNVTVHGMIELQPKANVSGHLRYRSIEIHRGAVVEATLAPIDQDGSRPGLKLASSNDAKARNLAISG
jgi:cytoskeletal protein CcmA (bactofilin family)